MLCNTELMQPALVSSTGDSAQCGITCGEAFTGGFDGGTMPDAPALSGAPVARPTAQPVPAATARTSAEQRSRQGARAGWVVPPHDPFAPSCSGMDQPGQRNISTSPTEWSPVPFFDTRVVSRLCRPVPMALSPVGDGHQTRKAGRGDRGDPWGDHHPAPFSIDR